MAVICVGRTNALAGYKFGPLHKKDNCLLIVGGGRGTVCTNTKTQEFSAGDVVGFLKDRRYTWWTDPKALLEHYWITIEGDGGLKCLQALGISENNCVLHRKSVPEAEIILLEQLMEFCRTHPHSPSWKAISLFYDLCHSVSSTTGNDESDVPQPGTMVTDAARELLDGQYTQCLSINTVARQVGVTPEYLATAFRQRFGITPQAYLIELRLKRATALLKAGISVKEACYSVGYKDPNYFTTLYRKKAGVTPSSVIHAQGSLLSK